VAVITCPSGLQGEIRGFKVKEANLLADRASLKRGTALDSVLAGCWLQTIDSGPYPWLEAGKPVDWSKALVCDRFYTLMRIRAETFGEEYAFKLQCANTSCNERFEWELALSDLPVKPLPEESRAIILAGDNRFETTLSDGRKCWFSLQTGANEIAAASALRTSSSRILLTALAHRIQEVEGIPKGMPISKYLEELDMRDILNLLALFDEVDGGIETDIDVECTVCGTEQGVSLPFGADFFLPRPKKSTSLGR
jgi:hypothetical protein